MHVQREGYKEACCVSVFLVCVCVVKEHFPSSPFSARFKSFCYTASKCGEHNCSKK